MKKRTLIGMVMVLCLCALGRGAYVFAGSLDSPGEVSSDSDSRMYTIENIYDYLTDVDNALPSKPSGGFNEPAEEATAGTMHTLDDVFGSLTRFPASGQTGTFVTGDDGDLEKGAALRYQDNGDGTVTDLNTGLMWELKTDDSGIHDKDNIYTWADAFSVFIAGVNSAEFAGYTDWRLPNLMELQSIVNYGNWDPAIGEATVGESGTGAPFTNTISGSYWSSTTEADGTGGAWRVGFVSGYVGGYVKTYNFYARCVRGGQ